MSRKSPLLASLTLLAGLSAQAADLLPLERVEVAGQALPVRTDVLSTCRDVQAQLTDGLARAVHRIQENAEFVVRFDLRDGQIEQVTTPAAWNAYRMAVRQAMQDVHCNSQHASGQPQRYAFRLAIRVDGTESEAGRRLAVTALTPVAVVGLP